MEQMKPPSKLKIQLKDYTGKPEDLSGFIKSPPNSCSTIFFNSFNRLFFLFIYFTRHALSLPVWRDSRIIEFTIFVFVYRVYKWYKRKDKSFPSIFFLSMCLSVWLGSDTYINSWTRIRTKFFLLLDCLWFQNKELIIFWTLGTASELLVQKYRKLEKKWF